MAQYIDKSALVAEIEKWISGWTERLNNTNPSNPSFFEGGIEMGKHILSFINTLEVKEVDLEEEFENEDLIDLYKTCEWIRKNYGEEAVFNFCKVMEE